MSTPPDYYAVLQVDRRAEREVIDAAYRRLAAKYHPDVSREPSATERMAQLNVAYEVLADPARRAAYDASRRPTAWASRSRSNRPGDGPRAMPRSLHITVHWLPGLLVLAAVILAARAFRLGPGETTLVVIVASVLWLLARKR